MIEKKGRAKYIDFHNSCVRTQKICQTEKKKQKVIIESLINYQKMFRICINILFILLSSPFVWCNTVTVTHIIIIGMRRNGLSSIFRAVLAHQMNKIWHYFIKVKCEAHTVDQPKKK